MPKGSQIETTASVPVTAPVAPATPKKPAAPVAGAPKATPAAPPPGPSLADLLEGSRRGREGLQREADALEAVKRIEGLRRQGQIGPVGEKDDRLDLGSRAADAGRLISRLPPEEKKAAGMMAVLPTRYPSMQPMPISGESKPSRLGGTAPAQARVVAPTRTPTPADLTKTRNALVAEAQQTAQRFETAIAARDSAEAEIANKIRSGEARAQEMPELAKRQKAALQEVLNLAAQMREYGFVGSNEELIEQFAPK